MTDIQFTPEDETEVGDMLGHIVARNRQLIGQLRILGRDPSANLWQTAAIETLLDIVFEGDAVALKQYYLAVEQKVGDNLQAEVSRLMHDVQNVSEDE